MHDGPASEAPASQGGGETAESPLGEITRTALVEPARLPADAGARVARALEEARTADDLDDLVIACGAVAALLLGRPSALDAATPGRLVALLEAATGAAERAALARACAGLAQSPLAGASLALLLDAAEAGRLHAALGEDAVRVLAEFHDHHPGLWTLAAAERVLPPAGPCRELFLARVLEPLLVRDLASLTAAAVARLSRRLVDSPRWRTTLLLLADRPGCPRAMRLALRAETTTRPSYRAAAEPYRGRALEVQVLYNVRAGQGDELIRVAPLVQSLLGLHAATVCTVITPRLHLYDHPRVRAVSIGDPRVESLLAQPVDVRLVVYEPSSPRSRLRPELESVLAGAAPAPPLLLRGDVGRGQFLFQRVRLGTRELAFALALDRATFEQVYDPGLRLLLELGWPTRVGEEDGGGTSPLVGAPSADAAALWRRLVPVGRRAAVVNPFGGAHRLKGYLPQQAGEIAVGLASLIGEGFRVVLAPNGEPWSAPAVVAEILAAVPEALRTEVVLAPDPAVADESLASRLAERVDLCWADRAMRLQKYFVAYADLVVAVEGWMGHLAYQLGRPFRLLLRTDSDTERWYPPLRGPRQRLAGDLAAAGPPRGADRLDGTAPLPSLPRKRLLLVALRALGRQGDTASCDVLRRVLASPDAGLRAAALTALSDAARRAAGGSEVVPLLLRELANEWSRVRAAAAAGLLALASDVSGTLGPRGTDTLRAHVAIGAQRWQEVLSYGAAALPAIAAAVRDTSPVIRDEAQWAASRLLGEPAATLRASGRS